MGRIKTNPLFEECLSKVDPKIREEVRMNMTNEDKAYIKSGIFFATTVEMKHIKNDKHMSYKKYLVEIPEDKIDCVDKQLVWDLFDNELDIQVKVTGIE